MKRRLVGLLTVLMCLLLMSDSSFAEVSVGLKADDDGINSFYLSVGEQYRVPEKEVIVIREKKVSDDELPVVFLIARRASVQPVAVVNLRLAGKSWMDITLHFGLSPAIYYVAFEKDPGPPYGKAWGYYKKHKKEEWKSIRLGDSDIVNFVNVKFMCDRYGYTPAQVIQMRDKNESFVFVNSKIKKHKEGKSKEHADSDNPGKNKSNKGKGKDK
ncbi:MAG TPA: hypothetical protein VHP63_00185 [candidate division Zixibacteria bacterium]|nr:hypothetical protein [candidate division Zixibacteria bacterium]